MKLFREVARVLKELQYYKETWEEGEESASYQGLEPAYFLIYKCECARNTMHILLPGTELDTEWIW